MFQTCLSLFGSFICASLSAVGQCMCMSVLFRNAKLAFLHQYAAWHTAASPPLARFACGAVSEDSVAPVNQVITLKEEEELEENKEEEEE